MRFSVLVALMAALLITPAAVAADNDWIFLQGYYTHSPTSGVRVAQYMPLPRVAPLPDSRAVTSGYRRSRITQRGPNGTVDDHYVVENWGNGRGGLDAEWERFHDAWRSSYLSGGYGAGGYGTGWPGYRPWGPGGYGGPGYGGPGQGGWGPAHGPLGPGHGAVPYSYGGMPGQGYGPGPSHRPPH